MPSFDIVSEVSIQEIDNAVNQAQKELASRYDFKGKKYDLVLDKQKCEMKLTADSETHVIAMADIINSKLLKRGIDLVSLDVDKIKPVGGMMMSQSIKVKQGLETDVAKKITKTIKDSKLKVDTQIQDKQIRVTGKKIDDLQEVISLLKEKQQELKIPMQFVNMKN
ncbi:YajQ family cyclic di-GMP-binding protein [Silvanigrella aquatica]|uniref:Nucleotide-binding protein AXG55_05405 n=1 Tax=Silvanigrella aquatica TaxID=1915309 RepID=A0A1L4CZJ4_9BACT|nr:YajQ family cyclic di-GMP-binding protein [Silvanigrella aquatica]APJ03372.1 YajQ family cyclic di-GMP-binding protein [Silvanigrella aquatica]